MLEAIREMTASEVEAIEKIKLSQVVNECMEVSRNCRDRLENLVRKYLENGETPPLGEQCKQESRPVPSDKIVSIIEDVKEIKEIIDQRIGNVIDEIEKRLVRL